MAASRVDHPDWPLVERPKGKGNKGQGKGGQKEKAKAKENAKALP